MHVPSTSLRGGDVEHRHRRHRRPNAAAVQIHSNRHVPDPSLVPGFTPSRRSPATAGCGHGYGDRRAPSAVGSQQPDRHGPSPTGRIGQSDGYPWEPTSAGSACGGTRGGGGEVGVGNAGEAEGKGQRCAGRGGAGGPVGGYWWS